MSEITKQEAEDWGDEFFSVVGKKTREVAGPELARLNQRVIDLQNALAQTARDGMKTILDRDVPAWREINERPEFLAALGGRDEYSGVVYHDLLKRAWNANNVPVVKSYFEKAAQDMGYQKPPPAAQPRRQSTNETFQGVDGLRYPGKGPQGKTIQRAEVNKFYTDCAKGRFKNNEAERQRIENEIMQAGREGRIV
jgi:hypothetical protein